MEKKKFRKKRVGAMIAAGTTAAMLAFAPAAYANDCEVPIPTVGYSASGHVTSAATRAATPAPEILGIDVMEESGQFVDSSNWYNWAQPKYCLFGSVYNANFDPYLINKASGLGSAVAVDNASRQGGGVGPNASLAAYGSDATDDDVWELMPDVIVGTGGSTDYDASAEDVADALETTYSTVGVPYAFTNNEALVTSMYNIASAADATVTAKGKALRYSDTDGNGIADETATSIAERYEHYIKGLQGYVYKLQQQANDPLEVRTVASVSGYDATNHTFTLRATNAGDGTASVNRYLEAVQPVANNYNTGTADMVVTAADLNTALLNGAIDLVLVGGQQGGTTDTTILQGLQTELTAVTDYTTDPNIYYTESSTAGSTYGTIMNSVENAQNIGRILGFLYPEAISEKAAVSYYYEQFYHIRTDALTVGETTTNYLACAVCCAMDHVSHIENGDTTKTLDWTSADGVLGTSVVNANDGVTTVQEQINEGIAYIQTLGTSAPQLLQLQ